MRLWATKKTELQKKLSTRRSFGLAANSLYVAVRRRLCDDIVAGKPIAGKGADYDYMIDDQGGRKMNKKLIGVMIAAILFASGTYAFTNGGGKSGAAPGQAKAIANCVANIAKQNANGQTGANTGSANDKKQLDTAVTNCDHFWN